MFSFKIKSGMKIGKIAEDNPRYGVMASALVVPSASADGNEGDEGNEALVICGSGKSLALCPVQIEGDIGPHAILIDPLAVAANGSDRKVDVGQEVRATDRKGTNVFPPVSQEGRVPPYKDIIPDTMGEFISLTVDAKLLTALASAVSPSGKLQILVPPAGKDGSVVKPVCAIGYDGDGAVSGLGIIMPMAGHTLSDGTKTVNRIRGMLPAKIELAPAAPTVAPAE